MRLYVTAIDNFKLSVLKRRLSFLTSIVSASKPKSKMASPNSHTYTELDDVTAKDSFLKNRDLMAYTLSHLQVKNIKKYQCLFNTALTCKYFLDVALDALWEEMDSLVPLLKLLPALQVEDKGRDEAYVCANVHHDVFI